MKGYAVPGGTEWSVLFCGRYTPEDGAAAVHCTCSSVVQPTATVSIVTSTNVFIW